MVAWRGTCKYCSKVVLEVVFPSGVKILCDPGKKRHIAVGGEWDSCCIWGYQMHDCKESIAAGKPPGIFEPLGEEVEVG